MITATQPQVITISVHNDPKSSRNDPSRNSIHHYNSTSSHNDFGPWRSTSTRNHTNSNGRNQSILPTRPPWASIWAPSFCCGCVIIIGRYGETTSPPRVAAPNDVSRLQLRLPKRQVRLRRRKAPRNNVAGLPAAPRAPGPCSLRSRPGPVAVGRSAPPWPGRRSTNRRLARPGNGVASRFAGADGPGASVRATRPSAGGPGPPRCARLQFRPDRLLGSSPVSLRSGPAAAVLRHHLRDLLSFPANYPQAKESRTKENRSRLGQALDNPVTLRGPGRGCPGRLTE